MVFEINFEKRGAKMRAWLATELQILKPNLQLTKYSFVPSGFFLFAFKDILDSTNE